VIWGQTENLLPRNRAGFGGRAVLGAEVRRGTVALRWGGVAGDGFACLGVDIGRGGAAVVRLEVFFFAAPDVVV
jgi:hypothetical protein